MASILFEKTKKKKIEKKKVYFFLCQGFDSCQLACSCFRRAFNFKLDRFGKKN